MKEINFITFFGGVIKCVKGVWKDNKPQACLCAAFIPNNCVTGMFNGNIYVWDNKDMCI